MTDNELQEMDNSPPMFKIENFNAPFTRNLVLQNTLLSKQPFITQPQTENEDVNPWSPQYNMPATTTNKRRALSLQKVGLDGWFLIRHIVLETCTI